jgi:hypothetical protein
MSANRTTDLGEQRAPGGAWKTLYTTTCTR